MVQGIGEDRIKYLYNLDDYFSDMHSTYKYLSDPNGGPKEIDGTNVNYKVVDTYENLDFNSNIINVIPTIEGGHVFLSKIDFERPNSVLETEILANIKKLKSPDWGATPFFVSLAHHFPNKICGHGASLTGLASLAYDQELNPNDGILPLGEKVIESLLSKDNGKRILIDIKHMNLLSRREFLD